MIEWILFLLFVVFFFGTDPWYAEQTAHYMQMRDNPSKGQK